jgi:hypothetical protein
LQISPYRSAFLSRCFPPHRGDGVYLWCPPNLGFRGWQYTRGGNGSSGLGQRGQGWARAPWWWAHPAAPLASSFWLLSSSDIIWISGYFSGIVDLQKYGVLMVLFPAESWLWQQVLQWSSNM